MTDADACKTQCGDSVCKMANDPRSPVNEHLGFRRRFLMVLPQDATCVAIHMVE